MGAGVFAWTFLFISQGRLKALLLRLLKRLLSVFYYKRSSKGCSLSHHFGNFGRRRVTIMSQMNEAKENISPPVVIRNEATSQNLLAL